MLSSNEIATGSVGSTSKCCWPFSGVVPPHSAVITMSAPGAPLEMTAECGGTTPLNGQQHFDVLPTEPVAISLDEGISRGADQIGHLEWWPGHLLFLRRTAFERQRIQRTRGRMQVTLGEMQIAGRLFQIVMT